MIEIDEQQIQKALDALEKGGVIVMPTETSYGLGCDATNPAAVARVFEIKGRPENKGLPVLIVEPSQAEEFVYVSDKARELMKRYWPGDLNLVLPVREESSIAVACNEEGAQSVRVSSHPIASTLVRRFGKPITASSANLSGQEPVFDIARVRELFKDQPKQPDFILDGGRLREQPASTIVKIEGDDNEILRQGRVVL